MKKTAINFKYAVMTVLVALLAAFACFAGSEIVGGAYAEEVGAVLVIGDNGKTVTGVTVTGDGAYTVEIPESVEEISDYAFVGKKQMTGVTFAHGSKLKKIGNFAFAGTGVTKIDLPEGLTDIGVAAFADGALINVDLPSSLKTVGKRAFGVSSESVTKALTVTLPEKLDADLVLGEESFNDNVIIVANDKQQYSDLSESGPFAEYCTADSNALTYPVEIKYYYLGVLVDTEIRLFGASYGYQLVDGIWTEVENPALGTNLTGINNWYLTEASSDVVSVADVTAALGTEGVTEVKLYAKQAEEGEKIFVARDDLVFDPDAAYGPTELNPILSTASDRITRDMTVNIAAYVDPDGVKAATAPNEIHNAGTYTVSIGYGEDKTADLTVTVARKKVDLADYANLMWTLADGTHLMDGNGVRIYLYTLNGEPYPSLDVLTDEQIAALGVGSTYTETTVRYSVARHTGAAQSVVISSDCFDIDVDAESDANGTDVGVYTTKATLTSKGNNYELVLSRPVSDAAYRGVTVTVGANGKTAEVSKTWYIAEMSNWFGTFSANYSISDLIYGQQHGVDIPRLVYGDVDASEYGSAADPVSLELTYGNEKIGATFRRDQFAYYINSAMPAGTYTLTLHATATYHEEPVDPDDEDNTDTIKYSHNAVTFSLSFVVEKGTLNQTHLDKIHEVIKGNSFYYEWDGKASPKYKDSDDYAVSGALTALNNATPNRTGTVWANYDAYYGSVVMSYNLAKMQSDEYSTSVSTVDPDAYTVYYAVSAPNYYSSIERLAAYDSRTAYFFRVYNVCAIDIPTVLPKKYNGETLTADIAGNEYYVVTANAGGKNAGTYYVTLRLIDPDCYMWSGQKADNPSRLSTTHVEFVIEQAANSWVGELSIQNWVVGKFDESKNRVIGAAKFGNETMHIVVTDSAEKVVYDSAVDGVDKLKALEVGTYRLRAVIDGNDNYTGVSDAMFFNVFKAAGLPWWAVLIIVLGVLLVVALVIFILWKLRVFEFLTDKVALAIRTKANVDATIAAVRAAKRAEEGKASVEAAKAKERAEERRAKALAERQKPAEQRAIELEQKAQAASLRAERMRQRAEAMQQKAAKLREKSAPEAAQQQPTTEEPPVTADETPEQNNAEE